MTELECKVLVLGGGPGGYVAAIRAGQLGLDTILVEADNLGGTCLNVGCIPSKAYIHVAEQFMQAREHQLAPQIGIHVKEPVIDLKETKKWKDGIVKRLTGGVGGLLKKAKVNVIKGWGYMENGKTCTVKTEDGGVTIRAEHVILATGSTPVELPFMKFNGRVINSTQALALKEVPEKLVVVGAGYIGLELGSAFAKMGSQVTVVEGERRILPQYDAELTAPVKKRLGKLHIEVLTQTKAKGLTKNGKGIRVQTEGQPETDLDADKILVAVGRKPAVTGWGLDELMLDRDGPFIKIDDQCRTSMREVYAIGDVTGDPMLAHRAMAQGEMVAEIIAGENRRWDKVCIPAVCFTDPEVVTAGLSPDEAREQGHDITTGIFPFAANGRAMTLQSDGGFVRIVARADNHLVLGIQAVGAHVSELSASFSLALEMGARLEDIAATIHAHPTQSEGFQEAALLTLGHALHI